MRSYSPQTKKIHTTLADLVMKEAGIILITFIKDGELNETCAIEILSGILELSGGKPHCLLYDFNNKSVLLSNIAKKMASGRGPEESKLLARAFLTSSLQNDLEAGHFIHHSKPASETRIFRSSPEALNWLRTWLNKAGL
jgi:hypothetical protein